jgi:hypothetical protein
MEDSIRHILIMEQNEFKKLFGDIAKKNGFNTSFGGWYKNSKECIVVLELQKSNFGDYYMLLIKIFVHGIFESIYAPNKDLIKSPMGHFTTNETSKYQTVLELDNQMDDNSRKELLKELFISHIIPFTNKALSKEGIKALVDSGEVYLLPAVKKELGW